jgi:hypothetical protein
MARFGRHGNSRGAWLAPSMLTPIPGPPAAGMTPLSSSARRLGGAGGAKRRPARCSAAARRGNAITKVPYDRITWTLFLVVTVTGNSPAACSSAFIIAKVFVMSSALWYSVVRPSTVTRVTPAASALDSA